MANTNEERKNSATENDLGFDTVRNSTIEKRQKTQLMQKYTIFSLIALVALIAVMLVVLAIGGIVSNIAGYDDENPNKGPAKDDVEWANLTLYDADTKQGPLMLVNSTHAYTFPETTDHLEEIYSAWAKHEPRIYKLSGLSRYMESSALNALDAMLTDFYTATAKDNILLSYAYRSYDEQADIGSSTGAGYSDHHTGFGCVLKFTNGSANYDLSADPAYSWITENCHKYGFVIRYPDDKADLTGVSDYTSYFRYVGVAHATYMTEHDLCLEEYVTILKDYSQDKPLKINGADGNYYEVCYVAVSGSASIKCPVNFAYTLSGTNEGGAVLTVNRSEVLSPEGESTDTEGESTADSTTAN